MSRLQNLYTGLAGQYAVMSEFLIRGYNVAAPGVDRGDDIFVIQDTSDEYKRVQVKTAVARDLVASDGYFAQFALPYRQLQTPSTPELYYALQVRCDARWSDLLLIARETLAEEHALHGLGTLNRPSGSRISSTTISTSKETLQLRLTFQGGKILCKGRDLASWRDNFGGWPALQH